MAKTTPAKKKPVSKAAKRSQPAKDRTTAMKKKAMLLALQASLGIVTRAIDAMNKKGIGIERKTHYNWMESDPEYAQAVREIDDVALDFGEASLVDQIRDRNTAATIFYLKTKGKSRGYIERQEITGKDGEALQKPPVKFKLPDGTEIDM